MVALVTSYNAWPQDARPLQSPDDCVRAYQVDRLAGALHNPEQRERDRAELAHFGDIAARFGIADSGRGQLLLPFLAVVRCEAKRLGITGTDENLCASVWPWPERQTTGDCVSHWARNACDIVRACEIVYGAELEDWIVRTATEPIYGYRGHGGAGADCGRLARWISSVAGMLLRQKYDGLRLDLSAYDASIGIAWGRSGVPESVRREAAIHPIKETAIVSDLDEVRDAMARGFGIGGCSGYGYSSQRDANGVSKRGSGWAHAMAWTAFDDRPETHRQYGGPLILIQNSWGKWNSGPRLIWGTKLLIPFGSFWVRWRDAAGMLANGSFFAFSRADGWAAPLLAGWGAAGVV